MPIDRDATPNRPGSRIARRPARGAIALACLICAALLPAQAKTIYKYIDSDGNIVFTDQPTKGAQKIHVHPPPPIPLTPIKIPHDNDKPSASTTGPSTPAKPSAPQSPTAPQPPAAAKAATAPQQPAKRADSTQSQPPLPVTRLSPPSAAQTRPAENAATATKPSTPAVPDARHATPASSASSHTTASKTTSATAKPASKPSSASQYQSLTIARPHPGLQKLGPGGTMIVQLNLTPALNRAAGDRIRLTVDGQTVVDDSTGMRHLINGLKPGRHTLIAMVMRSGKSLIQSAPVTFELADAPD